MPYRVLTWVESTSLPIRIMFDYHSKLKPTHPFSSTWWEWPLIRKPIWYYGGTELAPGRMASIVCHGQPGSLVGGNDSGCATFDWMDENETIVWRLFYWIAATYLPWVSHLQTDLYISFFLLACHFSFLCIVFIGFGNYRSEKPAFRKWTHLAGAVLCYSYCFILFYQDEIYVSYADGILNGSQGGFFMGKVRVGLLK